MGFVVKTTVWVTAFVGLLLMSGPAEAKGRKLRVRVSGCRHDAAATATRSPLAPGYGSFTVEVRGNDICVFHKDARYNCCATVVVVLRRDRQTLVLTEKETYPGDQSPCKCVCYYDIRSRIEDLAPGDYTVEVRGPEGVLHTEAVRVTGEGRGG